jgi:hypothetical protein
MDSPIRLCRRSGRELDEGRPDHPVMAASDVVALDLPLA